MANDFDFLLSVGGTPVSYAFDGVSYQEGWNFGRWYSQKALESFQESLPEPNFAKAAPELVGTGDNKDVFAWELEEKVLGKRLPAWNQGSIGSCVSHGCGRAAQDLLLAQVFLGNLEEWPGYEVCREAIYGGSRVQVGHDGGGGDGSVGAWGAGWLKQYGIILYKKYGSIDLSNGYDIQRCKSYGSRGCPKELEDAAKEHPLGETTCITSQSMLQDAIANLYFISICGSLGRTMKRQSGGWCPVQGTWQHCQEINGVCVVKGGSSSPFGGDGATPYSGDTVADVYRNSWGDYLGSDNNQVTLASGRTITLPDGCYLSHPQEVERDLRQQDTFAYSHAKAWPAQNPYYV